MALLSDTGPNDSANAHGPVGVGVRFFFLKNIKEITVEKV